MRVLGAGVVFCLAIAGCGQQKGETTSMETGGGSSVASRPEEPLQAGSPAPQFTLAATDGKTYSQSTLTNERPAFLYFFKLDCSGNPQAVPIVTSLSKAYGDKIDFYGVINSGKAGADSERSQYGFDFDVLLDEDKDLIHSYGLKRSQYVYLVGKDGKIAKVFPGFGKESMEALNAAMAEAAGVPVATIDLSGAPDRQAFG